MADPPGRAARPGQPGPASKAAARLERASSTPTGGSPTASTRQQLAGATRELARADRAGRAAARHARAAPGPARRGPRPAAASRGSAPRRRDELPRQGADEGRSCAAPASPAPATRADDDRRGAARFVAQVGYPVVLKPPAGRRRQGDLPDRRRGASSRGARAPRGRRASAPVDRRGVRHRRASTRSTPCSIRGEAIWHSLTHYLPAPLHVVENPWIQWCVLLPARDRRPALRRHPPRRLRGARRARHGHRPLAHGVVPPAATAASLISEVGARPPGAQITSLISYAHDVDFYAAWARLVVHGQFTPPRRAVRRRLRLPARPGRGAGHRGARPRQALARPRADRGRGEGCRRSAPGPRPATRARATSSCATPRRRWSSSAPVAHRLECSRGARDRGRDRVPEMILETSCSSRRATRRRCPTSPAAWRGSARASSGWATSRRRRCRRSRATPSRPPPAGAHALGRGRDRRARGAAACADRCASTASSASGSRACCSPRGSARRSACRA